MPIVLCPAHLLAWNRQRFGKVSRYLPLSSEADFQSNAFSLTKTAQITGKAAVCIFRTVFSNLAALPCNRTVDNSFGQPPSSPPTPRSALVHRARGRCNVDANYSSEPSGDFP